MLFSPPSLHQAARARPMGPSACASGNNGALARAIKCMCNYKCV